MAPIGRHCCSALLLGLSDPSSPLLTQAVLKVSEPHHRDMGLIDVLGSCAHPPEKRAIGLIHLGPLIDITVVLSTSQEQSQHSGFARLFKQGVIVNLGEVFKRIIRLPGQTPPEPAPPDSNDRS